MLFVHLLIRCILILKNILTLKKIKHQFNIKYSNNTITLC